MSEIITIDGPGGSGKSTIARMMAKNLGFVYLDTGAMYRAVALAAMRNKIPFDQGALLGDLCSTDLQRRLAQNINVVAEGRDMGTVVFPNAKNKFFLTARPEVRAQRRYLERKGRGEDITFEEVERLLKKRDRQDESRNLAPLKPAEDAGDEANLEQESSSEGSFMELYEESLRSIQEGEVVRGEIVQVDKEYVLVDIGYKSEGQIRIEEFIDAEGKPGRPPI
ncbi:MAG: hypothetical protein B1H13_01370 [Desulfobacteraceae bacterium 4484_190.3]|nr:MAG: hypothetical protein B1H13_01370 [Desulfobacteraceae bacterium 4484_190.3]